MLLVLVLVVHHHLEVVEVSVDVEDKINLVVQQVEAVVVEVLVEILI